MSTWYVGARVVRRIEPSIPRRRRAVESPKKRKARLARERRDKLRAAKKCINGPMEGNVGQRGFEHGPPVDKSGRCAACSEARKASR